MTSRRLESFDWSTSGWRASKYPWDEWLDGSPWEINPSDYGSIPRKVRLAAHRMAGRRGLKVRTAIRGDLLVLQAFPREVTP